MSSTRLNALDQALDIAGSLTQTQTLTLSEEANGLGAPISGQTGSSATIASVSLGIVTITGLTGMTDSSKGRFITITGAATVANNGTFLIDGYISNTSVTYVNASGVFPDANSGSISWTERNPYSLEDDINYSRTDRRLVKGTTNFYDAVPTYQRPTAVGTNVPANLTNIAGKTTDAKALTLTRLFKGQSVSVSDGYITLNDTGNLKHADATDRTGVPINDGADSGAHESTYVEIIDPQTQSALEIQGGPNDGYRIFGRTRAGTTGVSPNSVEVEFRAVPKTSSISSSIAYTWTASEPSIVDFYYGFRERIDNFSDASLRTTLVNGIIGDADTQQDVVDIRTTIGTTDGSTDLAGLLTNTSAYFAFNNLPDVTPSIVEALNTLNSQIGDRNYTGAILVDGQTIADSLQALSNAVSGASITRVIERLSSDINANTAHTIPGGYSYTPDGYYNGSSMFVFTRGLLRDPGPIVDGNDYDETSTTSVTFYAKQKIGDHINYMILY